MAFLVRFEDAPGTFVSFENQPSPQDVEDAHQELERSRSPFESRLAKTAFPTAGGMLASAAMPAFAETGAEVGTMLGGPLGGLVGGGLMMAIPFTAGVIAGNRGRERLTESTTGIPAPAFPVSRALGEAASVFPSAALFGGVARGAEAGLGMLAPFVKPGSFLSRVAQPTVTTGVIPRFVRGAVVNAPAGYVVGGKEGAVESGLFGGLLGSGQRAFQALFQGNRPALQSLEQTGAQQKAQIQQAFQVRQAGLQQQLEQGRQEIQGQLGGVQTQEQQLKSQLAQQEQALKQSLSTGEQTLKETFTQRQDETNAQFETRIAKSESQLEQQLGAIDDQAKLATQGLQTSADHAVLEVQKRINQVRESQQARAWEPARQVAKSISKRFTQADVERIAGTIPEPSLAISAKQVFLKALRMLPDTDPLAQPLTEVEQQALSQIEPKYRARALASMRNIFTATRERTWSAQDLIDASTQIGAGGSKSVKSGRAAPTAEDLPNIQARTIAVRLLDEAAPPELKGATTQARQNWADFLRDDEFHRKYFRRGQFTDEGMKFLTDAATGNVSPSDQRYLLRLSKDLGYDPSASLTPFATRLQMLGKEAQSAKSAQRLDAKQIDMMKDRLMSDARVDYESSVSRLLRGGEKQLGGLGAGVETGLAEMKLTRARLDQELKDLLAKSEQDQQALAKARKGEEGRIAERMKTDIQSVKRQASIARWIAFLGFWPLRYVLINRPIYRAFRRR